MKEMIRMEAYELYTISDHVTNHLIEMRTN